ncbi:hypothetical protein BSKO_02633 [Bryopsis sp. KO-2023]|nr:hypothetical protein BSKO_02633 [Bryopsis sp. KO-2023]
MGTGTGTVTLPATTAAATSVPFVSSTPLTSIPFPVPPVPDLSTFTGLTTLGGLGGRSPSTTVADSVGGGSPSSWGLFTSPRTRTAWSPAPPQTMAMGAPFGQAGQLGTARPILSAPVTSVLPPTTSMLTQPLTTVPLSVFYPIPALNTQPGTQPGNQPGNQPGTQPSLGQSVNQYGAPSASNPYYGWGSYPSTPSSQPQGGNRSGGGGGGPGGGPGGGGGGGGGPPGTAIPRRTSWNPSPPPPPPPPSIPPPPPPTQQGDCDKKKDVKKEGEGVFDK